MNVDGRRPRRVAEQIREQLSQVLLTELADARLNSAVITRVDVTPDLGYADIYVRLMMNADAKARQRALQSLGRAAGHLRRGLGPKLRLKRVPELRFHYDTAPDARARVDELLSEWRRERPDSE